MSSQQILLINPNSSNDTTAMMVAIARSCVPADVAIVGATAARGPPMIVTPQALAAAADEVVEIGIREAAAVAGIIVGAFGDPGLETLKAKVSVPVVGICEASMIEAASGGRRFGVATVTPELVTSIAECARDLGLRHLFTGTRLTPGDPLERARDPARLRDGLAAAVAQCFDDDHAEAVIIGGGPLGHAATALAQSFDRPIIAPIPAAVARLLMMMRDRAAFG
jgi:allantoin racemase